MKTSDAERWAVEVLNGIDRGARREDDRVELKRQPKATALENARRIAGHANQVREGQILWLFGIDEDGTRHPLPSILADPNEWWPPIAACFDDVAPSPVFASVDGLLAVGFDTERVPFVIRHSDQIVSREVPWREGTRVRSANRFDLLRLLVPVASQPQLTLLSGFLNVIRKDPTPGTNGQASPAFEWNLRARLYADTTDSFVAPDHRLGVKAQFGKDAEVLSFTASTGNGADVQVGHLAVSAGDQLMVSGPSPFMVYGRAESKIDGPPVVPGAKGQVRITLGLNGDRIVQVLGQLAPAEPREPNHMEGGYDLAPVAAWKVEQ